MSIIFLDLDDTLLDRKSVYKIVSRKNIEKVYLELDESVKPLITGIWKRYDLPVNSMGTDYWLSEIIWNKIKSKNKNIQLTDLSIIFTDSEFNMKDESDFINMLKHLENVDGEIRIFANMHLNDKEDYLSKVKNVIQRVTKKEIRKIHYIDDIKDDNANGMSMKLRIILETLIGYKIKANKFVEIASLDNSIVRYYNSDNEHINQMANIQDVFEAMLTKTDDTLQDTIKKQLESKKPELQLCYITNNAMKPFQTKRIPLVFPRYIKSFESYKLFF